MQRIDKIKACLEDKKGENIEVIDMRGSEYFVDFVLLATTMGERHAMSLLDHLKLSLKPEEEFLHVEVGQSWIVIDLGDIIIHLMDEDTRQKYDLGEFLASLKRKK